MALKVESIHFYELENAERHHTIDYEIVHMTPAVPVIRRGQSFNIALRFDNNDYVKGKDSVRVIFSCGPNPNAIKNTKGIIFVNDNDIELDRNTWCGKIVSNQNKTLVIELMSPVDAPVGPYEVTVDCLSGANKTEFTYDGDLWLLFNPWCKGDLVYMPDTDKLDEYVLSDVGKIWVGPMGSSRGRQWVFGQFDSSILPACILMLDRVKLGHTNRGDPIAMSRAISKIVNSNDDNGVLVGRWDGNYKDGTGPSTWTGSVDILDQYLTTGVPVKYGQCWVFAGVVTTVCRALGLPSRVITNLVSAHDSNGSLTIDKYYDKDNKELEYDPNNPMGEDSLWNYHVWNDVYMARPDLPKGYGGWQAIDATPQETSSGYYQCGPASLEAIRQGVVGLSYDVPFMISTVNADMMKWKIDENNQLGFQRIECNQYHVGRMILTKKPMMYDPTGEKDREDITYEYKSKEGTKDERLSLFNAVRNVNRAKRYYDVPENLNEDVEFSLVDLDRVDIGKPFSLTVKVTNKSKSIRTIEASLTALSIYYTGIKANTVKRSSGDVVVKAGATHDVRMTVRPEEYIEGLVEYCNMKISAICSVKETKQTWAAEDDFQVIKPNIIIRPPRETAIGKIVNIALSLTNPLDKKLTLCEFNVSGPGLIAKTITVPFRDIRPGETINITAPITPKGSGDYKIVATFTSKELSDITGSTVIQVA